MPISDNYYFYPQSDSLNYSVNPVGSLDVQRMLQNKLAHWQNPIAKREQNQKTLLLADCLANLWSPEKTLKIPHQLQLLLDEGFNIYLWQLDKYIRLTFNNVDLIELENIKSNIQYNPKLNFSDVAIKQLSKSKDELLVLDYFEIEKLVTKPSDIKLIADLNDKVFHFNFDYIIEREMNVKYIKNIKRKIVTDHYPKLKSVVDFERKSPDLTIERSKKTSVASLSSKSIEHLITNKGISDGGLKFTFAELGTLKALKLYSGVKILKYTLNLESLCLFEGKFIDVGNSLFKLGKLNNLKLGGSVISTKLLDKLLKVAPNLEFLHLVSNEIVGADKYSFTLEKLKVLNLREGIITNELIDKLLKSAPNLEVLSAINSEILNEDISKIYLPKLRTLNLSHNGISSNNLNLLLDDAIKLQLLNLNKLSQKVDISLKKLPLLKELIISDELSINSVKNLLSKSKQLKKLTIKSYKKNIVDLLSNIDIAQLEELTISYYNEIIDLENLKTILSKVKNLKSLSLQNVNIHSDHIINSGLTLNKLNHLDISCSNIVLDDLISNAPKLKYLDVSSCGSIKNNDIARINFPMLEYINLSALDISIKILRLFASKHRQLKTLKLIWCDIMNPGVLTWDELNLPVLESLDLSGVKTNIGCLEILIRSCRKLRVINLSATGITKADLYHKLAPYLFNVKVICDYVRNKTFDNSFKELDEVKDECFVDPTFDLNNHLNAAKTFLNAKTSYKFNKNDKLLNQSMIINKLNHFFKLKNDVRLNDIVKVEQGICLALSDLFNDVNVKQWQQIIKSISNWDGRLQTLEPPLIERFEVVWFYIQKIYLSARHNISFYNCGDNVELAINKISINQSVIMANPWHAISIRCFDANTYIVYDPNYVDGFKKTNKLKINQTISNSLGSVFSITNQKIIPKKLSINDINQFIKNGGLLSITAIANSQQVLDVIKNTEFTLDELSRGLTLVSSSNKPAWFKGLISHSSKIKKFTASLLIAYYNKVDEITFKNKLKLISLNNYQQKRLLIKIKQQSLFSNEIRTALTQIITKVEICNAAVYDPLGTPATPLNNIDLPINNIDSSDEMEVKDETSFKSSNAFLDKIKKNKSKLDKWLNVLLKSTSNDNAITNIDNFNGSLANIGSKTLIEVSNNVGSVKNTIIHIQKYYKNNQQPLFYIDSVDDLMCSAPFNTLDKDNNIICHQGPGGPLHGFLTAEHHNQSPVLLINYNNFDADDVVKFNSMLDDIRKCDGTNIPKTFKIIGVINPKKIGVYQGADFYSRFDSIKNATDLNLLNQAPLIKPLIKDDGYQYELNGDEIKSDGLGNDEQKHETTPLIISGKVTRLDLFEATDWQVSLLGRSCIDADNIQFKPGKLIEVIQKLDQSINIKPLTLILENAPWQDEKFNLFWQQTLLNRKFSYMGETYNLPQQLNFAKDKGYNWQQLTAPIKNYHTELTARAIILNKQTFHKFFSQYTLNNTKLKSVNGFVNENINTLDVNITELLELAQWAKLLH